MYAMIKLCTGEELIAGVVEYKDKLRLTDPVIVVRHDTEYGPLVSVAWWLTFLKEQTIDVDRDKIVAFKYGLDDNAERHYVKFTSRERLVKTTHETVEMKSKDTDADIQKAQTILNNLIKGASSNTTIH